MDLMCWWLNVFIEEKKNYVGYVLRFHVWGKNCIFIRKSVIMMLAPTWGPKNDDPAPPHRYLQARKQWGVDVGSCTS